MHRASKPVGALALIALVVPTTGFTEPPVQSGAVEQLQAQIENLEARDGPNASGLVDPLTALGILYREAGAPLLAAAALERAVHVVRIHYGLHSLEQAALARELIESAEMAGAHEWAWDLEQDLLALGERNPDDVRTARIFTEVADRRMDVLTRYTAGEFPPEIYLGCYYADPPPAPERNCMGGSRSHVQQRLVREAQGYYSQAIAILLRNEDYANDELPRLFWELVRSSYDYGNERLGKRSLEYLLALENSKSEPLVTRVDTLVQIADWELLHSHSLDETDAALDVYERAYALLGSDGTPQKSIDALFAPAVPVVLPAFEPNPLQSEETRDTTGHIDVRFEITKQGRSRHVEVLAASGDSTRADEKRLAQLIASSRFRPRSTHGRFVDSAPLVVRYYLSDDVGVRASEPVRKPVRATSGRYAP